MLGSFGSFLKTSARVVRARAVGSREEVLAAAVYYSAEAPLVANEQGDSRD